MAFSASAVLFDDTPPAVEADEGTVIRSCVDCPSYRAPGDVPPAVSPLGSRVPYCALKGIPLGTMLQNEDDQAEVLETTGTKCEDWGKDHNERINKGEFPNPRVATIGTKVELRPKSGATAASNCSECVHMLPPSEVRNRFGWPMGMCLAKGELIPGKRFRGAARRCEHGEQAGSFEKRTGVSVTIRQSPDQARVEPLPLYNIKADPATRGAGSARSLVSVKTIEDPNLFVGKDKGKVIPVSKRFQDLGVRTWRIIPHPKDKKREPVYLPVFDRDYFSQEEQAKIPAIGKDNYQPELYIDHANLTWQVAASWAVGRTPMLIGPAGGGKTEAAQFLAFLMQAPFDRISIRSDTEPASIIGKQTVKVDPETQQAVVTWINGRLPKRWVLPGVLLLDEPNTGPDEVWHAIRPLTDSAAQLVLDENEGEMIERHPMCFMVMASNPPWDPTYVGIREPSEADYNRLFSIGVPYPPEDAERQIIVNKCNADGFDISQKQLDVLMALTKQVRGLVDEGQLRVAWGPRITIGIAKSLRFMTLVEAIGGAVLSRMDPTERDGLSTILKGFENV